MRVNPEDILARKVTAASLILITQRLPSHPCILQTCSATPDRRRQRGHMRRFAQPFQISGWDLWMRGRLASGFFERRVYAQAGS